MDARGAKVLITGATGGLGQAIAGALSSAGAELIFTGRKAALLEDLGKRYGAETIVADLADRGDLDGLCDTARGIDILIANAGIGQDSPIDQITDDEIDMLIDVNLRGPIKLATAFAQACLADGRAGQIVFVGSLSGLAASPETRMYNATKFGLRGYSLALRQDLADHDIGVSCVNPGFIRDAGMFHNGNIELPKGVRTKSPGDVADGVVRAIEQNPPEVFVAPIELRLGATLATIAPGISAKVQKQVDAAGRQRDD